MSIPTDFSGLIAWHEAYNDPNPDGSTITVLPGVGGMPWGPRGGGSASSGTGARPTVVTLGSGRRAYRFDSADDWISTAAVLMTVPFTVVIMYASKSTATDRRAVSNHSDLHAGSPSRNWAIGQQAGTGGTYAFFNGSNIAGPAIDVDVMHVHSVRQRASGVIAEYRFDGAAQGTNTAANVPGAVTLGSTSGGAGNADIIGIAVYGVALSDANLAAIEAYWLTGGGGTMTAAPVIPVGAGHLVMDADPDAMTGILANNDPLNLVTDSSTWGNDPTQIDPDMQGVFKTNVLNGYPVMEFGGFTPNYSGRGKYLQTPDILIPTDGSTFIALCRRIGAIPEHGVYTRFAALSDPWVAFNVLSHEALGGSPSLIGMGNSGIIETPGPALNAWFFYAIVFNSPTSATHYFNGPVLGTFNPHADADGLVGVSIGSGEGPTQTARAALYDIPMTCWQLWQVLLEWAIKYDLRTTISNTSGCPGQWGGVTTITQRLGNGTLRTSIGMGGQPKGGYKRWKAAFAKTSLRPPVNIPPEPPVHGGIVPFALVEETTILAAAFTDTAIQMPTNSTILSVSVLVTTAIPGPTTGFAVGDAADANRFQTATVGTTVGSSDPGNRQGIYYNAAATAVRLGMVGGSPGAATGVVRVVISGYTIS